MIREANFKHAPTLLQSIIIYFTLSYTTYTTHPHICYLNIIYISIDKNEKEIKMLLFTINL